METEWETEAHIALNPAEVPTFWALSNRHMSK